MNTIAELDVAQETRSLSGDELLHRASMFMKLEEMAKNEKISWR